MEHYEAVTETRSFSKVAPPPPERSWSRGHHPDLHHDPHARERSIASLARDERSVSRELSAEKESRWEYRGQGIWENRDSDYEGRWSEEREAGPSPGRRSLDRSGPSSAPANSTFTRKLSSSAAPGGASTATAGRILKLRFVLNQVGRLSFVTVSPAAKFYD